MPNEMRLGNLDRQVARQPCLRTAKELGAEVLAICIDVQNIGQLITWPNFQFHFVACSFTMGILHQIRWRRVLACKDKSKFMFRVRVPKRS